ncbi:hypothetical protein F4821DRAFT_94352 [Hypoxylon rubiginosum]|uniref:Uncharacterized protein n=1 Tax=Hypoxylon rubiginosum TaxID=110542 RepID=A0ACC0CI85_9PEZI|nr:hypothetical protein F4821DRAFT_94352 [Hypoxylon rubiginosum]
MDMKSLVSHLLYFPQAISKIDATSADVAHFVERYLAHWPAASKAYGQISARIGNWWRRHWSDIVLLDRGYHITILSSAWTSYEQRLTSQIAGALWEFPPGVCGQHTDNISLAHSKH